MMRLRILSTAVLTLSCLTLSAAFEDDVIYEEEIPDEIVEKGGAYALEANYDYIGYSHFTRSGFKCQKMRYAELDTTLSAACYFNPCYKEGAIAEIGYSNTNIGWFNNPYFNQHYFNAVNGALGVFTERLSCWIWKAKVGFAYDTDRNSFEEATAWDLMFWGRYARTPNLGVHIGFIGETGMRIDHAYPILGFDWTPYCYDYLKLSVVYPVDISLSYKINHNWSVAAASRFFDTRFRLAADDKTPSGLVTYEATGGEMRLTYEKGKWFSANIHGGGTLGGELKVANYKYRNKKHFKFKPAPYVGGEINLIF